jgi:hypothetical protein
MGGIECYWWKFWRRLQALTEQLPRPVALAGGFEVATGGSALSWPPTSLASNGVFFLFLRRQVSLLGSLFFLFYGIGIKSPIVFKKKQNLGWRCIFLSLQLTLDLHTVVLM